MFKYLWKDMLDAVQYLPFGLVVGLQFAIILYIYYAIRRKRPDGVGVRVLYITYVAIVLCITLFSRESGSREGFDLELFSTWGINDRNNAYVIENILLFVPYGFISAWAFKWVSRLIPSVIFGACSSILIECVQYATKRGYFQIDDILTNLLGSVIGYFIFRLLRR